MINVSTVTRRMHCTSTIRFLGIPDGGITREYGFLPFASLDTESGFSAPGGHTGAPSSRITVGFEMR